MKTCLLAVMLSLVAGLPPKAVAQPDAFRDIGPAFKNSVLEAAVGVRLRFNKALFWETIEIKASDGIVTLSGAVSTEERMNIALKIASETQGVNRVVNTLSIAK